MIGDKTTLLLIGALVGSFIVLWSFANWRWAVKLAFIAVIFEGAIRKWALPQAQELVYFLKDIFLLGAYLRFYLFPDPQIRAKTVHGPVFFVLLVGLIVSLSALNPNLNSILIGIFGIKHYFFYVPLLFVVPHVFKDETDLLNNLSWYSLIAIPVCLLGVAQFFSPADSFLNVYAHDANSAEASSRAVVGAKEFTRITGTFSYLTGLGTFLPVFTAIALVVITASKAKFQNINAYICLPLLLAAGYMSGSRMAVFAQLLVISGFVAGASAFHLSRRRGAALKLILVLAIATGVSMYLFREAANAFYERTQSSDPLQKRIIEPFTIIGEAYEYAGEFGLGLGVTHPAGGALRGIFHMPPPAKIAEYESEPAQIMAELGIFGFIAWYSFRLYLVAWSWKLFRLSPPGTSKALALSLTLIQIPHFLAQVVFNHTANFFIFALFGLALAPTLRPAFAIRRNGRPTVPTRS